MSKFKDVISNILYSTEEEIEELDIEEDKNPGNVSYMDDEPAKSLKEVKEKVNTISASDYLYNNGSSFLDEVNKKPAAKKVNYEPKKEEEYTPIQTISPVFGIVNEEKREIKKNTNSDLKKYKSSTVKSGYLETVISPIFGYASNYIKPEDYLKTTDDSFASSLDAKKDYDNYKDDLKYLFEEEDKTIDSLKNLFNETKTEFDSKEDKVEEYDGLLSLFEDKKD